MKIYCTRRNMASKETRLEAYEEEYPNKKTIAEDHSGMKNMKSKAAASNDK